VRRWQLHVRGGELPALLVRVPLLCAQLVDSRVRVQQRRGPRAGFAWDVQLNPAYSESEYLVARFSPCFLIRPVERSSRSGVPRRSGGTPRSLESARTPTG